MDLRFFLSLSIWCLFSKFIRFEWKNINFSNKRKKKSKESNEIFQPTMEHVGALFFSFFLSLCIPFMEICPTTGALLCGSLNASLY